MRRQMNNRIFNAAGEIDKCSLCATCTSVCPVYGITQMEGHTARGHMQLIDAFLIRPEGEVNPDGSVSATAAQPVITPNFESMLECCLRCYRCMDVCPSGIHTVAVFEEGRAEIAKKRLLPKISDWLMSKILPSRAAIHLFARLGSVAQAVLAIFVRPLQVAPGQKGERYDNRGYKKPSGDSFWYLGNIAIPNIAPIFFIGSSFADERAPKLKHAFIASAGHAMLSGASLEEIRDRVVSRTRKLKIGYLVDCMTDTLYPANARATVEILERAGCEVVIPKSAGCCGAPLLGTGDLEGFERMARAMLVEFSRLDCDYVIASNPTCCKTMKIVYPERFGKEFEVFSESVRMDFEVIEIVKERLRLENTGEQIGFHDPCHQRWAMGISKEPRSLLSSCAIYEPRDGEGDCCGFGGTFCVDFPKMAQDIAAKKGEAYKSRPEKEIATTCPACIYYINQASAKSKLMHKAVHLSEVVLRSMPDAVRRMD